MKIEREHSILKEHPHENVVSYLGRIDDEDMNITTFVMELCTTDLEEFRNQRTLSEDGIAVIMRGVIRDMEHLTSNAGLHTWSRDILVKSVM